ncbi:methyl-CpG-binding domain-containing protein 9 [Forsythia ovata]|uniref:Methyl-CpG-binding domain-containing protein 9 n=1 Tax=Forsythia ovata TaxID=205694 RepID=A0ABD1WB68_9LAMI
MLEHSINNEVYKGNASCTTKTAVISVLANVSRENQWQKAEKKEKGKIIIGLSDLIIKQCHIVLPHAHMLLLQMKIECSANCRGKQFQVLMIMTKRDFLDVLLVEDHFLFPWPNSMFA